MVLTGRRGRGKKRRKRRTGKEGGKEEEEEESLKSIALSNSRTWGARLTECASDPTEGGLIPSHLSQNFSTVHLSIWEQNGFAISWRLMN